MGCAENVGYVCCWRLSRFQVLGVSGKANGRRPAKCEWQIHVHSAVLGHLNSKTFFTGRRKFLSSWGGLFGGGREGRSLPSGNSSGLPKNFVDRRKTLSLGLLEPRRPGKTSPAAKLLPVALPTLAEGTNSRPGCLGGCGLHSGPAPSSASCSAARAGLGKPAGKGGERVLVRAHSRQACGRRRARARAEERPVEEAVLGFE